MIPTRPQGHHHHNYWPSLSTRSLKTLSTSSITITTTAPITTTISKALSLLSGVRKWFEGNVLGGKQLSPWTQVFVFWAIQFLVFVGTFFWVHSVSTVGYIFQGFGGSWRHGEPQQHALCSQVIVTRSSWWWWWGSSIDVNDYDHDHGDDHHNVNDNDDD